MKLKELFDLWGSQAQDQYADKQWLLSKWEVNEGIDWPEEKTEVMVKSLLQGLQPQPTDTIIELGCGGAWILDQLKTYTRKFYGLDFSMEMLKFADQQFKGDHLICGEIGQLPFFSNYFDCILSYYVFMNFDDDVYIEQSILEIIRVLKKGGRALIGQLPEREGSLRYEQAKSEYFKYCQSQFEVGKSIREEHKPPLRLFEKDQLSAFLNEQKVSFFYQDSFNPFYYSGQNKSIDWRFDLIIQKD